MDQYTFVQSITLENQQVELRSNFHIGETLPPWQLKASTVKFERKILNSKRSITGESQFNRIIDIK